MKKHISVLLTIGLLLLSFPSYAQPIASDVPFNVVKDTVKALEIITGDENGDLNLHLYVTRAEFAKMMVQASPYKNTTHSGSKTSVFTDVTHTHWAADVIKIAVDSGWLSGYLDGTFRPNAYVTLEEGANALLKQLGYTASDLFGRYPSAQISKFNALGLNKGVEATTGKALKRSDLMMIFYNLMEAEAKSGRPYGETLGYPMRNGKIDYSLLVSATTEGPYVYTTGNLFNKLPFSDHNVTYYRNGKEVNTLVINPYDIYTYNESLKTIWITSEKVSGLYTSAMPTFSAPSTVIIAGTTYNTLSNEAAYKLSDRGTFSIGEHVTLLLGPNNEVVDVISPSLVSETQYGIVTKQEKTSYTDTAGRTLISNTIFVACTDGVLRQYNTDNQLYSKGNIVSITFGGRDVQIKTITQMLHSGSLNAQATKYGPYDLSDTIEIIDTNTRGDFKRIYIERLKDTNLSAYNVRYFTLDDTGKINRMILNNATGDLDTYGIVTDVSETTTVLPSEPNEPQITKVSGIYSYQIDGIPGVFSTDTNLLGITEGPSIFWYADDAITDIHNMSGFILDTLTPLNATRLNTTYKIAEDVQVYQRISGEYHLVSLETVLDTNTFNLVAYKDSGFRAGNLIRVIVATEK